MLHQIEYALDFNTLSFTFADSDKLLQIDGDKKFNIIVVFSDTDRSPDHPAFKFDPNSHGECLQKIKNTLNYIDAVAAEGATMFVHGTPIWLPYYSVIMDMKEWEFKYWFAMETHHPIPNNNPIEKTHEGLLLYVRKSKRLNIRKVRAPHSKCDICADFTADWGGKSHMRHAFGSAISDVWDDFHQVRSDDYVLSNEVWHRLLCVSASNEFEVLIVDYTGKKDIIKYVDK